MSTLPKICSECSRSTMSSISLLSSATALLNLLPGGPTSKSKNIDILAPQPLKTYTKKSTRPWLKHKTVFNTIYYIMYMPVRYNVQNKILKILRTPPQQARLAEDICIYYNFVDFIEFHIGFILKTLLKLLWNGLWTNALSIIRQIILSKVYK